ncbi:hypothetical protein [Luteimonas saliphila]|uniref:hypothetical protein n=1 Tax=Luteimonas saliphila TaxID=2804919 RepID=UPI00192D66B8|nr:hypothetical protein [Luteimonas saliphila]
MPPEAPPMPHAALAPTLGATFSHDPMPAEYRGTAKQWATQELVAYGPWGAIVSFVQPGPAHRPEQYAGTVWLEGTFTADELRRILDALENP